MCQQHLIPSSAWSDYLMNCGICGHFGPRRRVESMIDRHCETFGLGLSGYLEFALENGIYSLLLHHGADPNAHPTPFTSAWTDFVRFGIKYPSIVTAPGPYLKTLDDFFKYGADLGVLTVGLTLRPGDASSHLPLCMITGWSTFCEALEDLPGFKTEKELKFISQITTKMIKQAMKTRWPLGRLPSIIRKVFPEAPSTNALYNHCQSNRSADLKTRCKRLSEENLTLERRASV
ncbi:uncharacterized protein F4807DRAFT_106296 [Annulohypoxylon truncatum]|uniref:uncharacterized protein n=1 Tax=Annulohypoxylon truncatum TaxID=327061 RepID=UPI0020073C99|nr:uncharacterized protein F4807DRAFT_106296 [Annulohypoxylon truncatum]KAI1208990.1 hypothetical protein F4807DRAFT_106296 [Annulohypoxylon truncatum]